MKRKTILHINGQDYNTEIEYKHTSYIKYQMKGDILIIRCPYFVTIGYLTDIISKKGFKKENHKKLPFDINYCYVYGEKQNLENNFVNIDGHFILFNKTTFYKDINKYFLTYIKSRVEFFEKEMGISEPYSITTRLVSSRYGSNSRMTHHLTFNSYLIHFSKDIIDAIVIHELAHNFYYDHSKKFYDYVYKYCPNYKELHKQLRLGNYEGVNN
jgi:Predicted metal-dependent hydrolase